MSRGTKSSETTGVDFAELLAHLDPGEHPLSTIRAKTSSDRLSTAIDDLNLPPGIAANPARQAPNCCAPMLVVLTDRRLLFGHEKRRSRRESGLPFLGAVPLDRIEGIEPRKFDKAGWSGRPYVVLAVVSLALLFVLFELENTLPNAVWWGLIITVGFISQGAAYGMVAGDYPNDAKYNFDLKMDLSNGTSVMLTLYGGPDRDSFLSAFRPVSDHR